MKKKKSNEEESYVPLNRSWLRLSENPDHHRRKELTVKPVYAFEDIAFRVPFQIVKF
jgi:hypothetical protein